MKYLQVRCRGCSSVVEHLSRMPGTNSAGENKKQSQTSCHHIPKMVIYAYIVIYITAYVWNTVSICCGIFINMYVTYMYTYIYGTTWSCYWTSNSEWTQRAMFRNIPVGDVFKLDWQTGPSAGHLGPKIADACTCFPFHRQKHSGVRALIPVATEAHSCNIYFALTALFSW